MMRYLSRLQVRRDPATAALRGLIDPDDTARAMDAHHRMIWSAFADNPDATRDFLWRAEGQGRFTVLSARPPSEAGLFEEPKVKPFAPDLRAGDRLGFVLRVNATRTLKGKGRVDVVMERLHDVPKTERAEQRSVVAGSAARDWLERIGARDGFAVHACDVQDYSVQMLPDHRGKRKGQPQFGVLDLSGSVEVTEAAAFLARVNAGFGRAKAFGCGLMLLRRI